MRTRAMTRVTCLFLMLAVTSVGCGRNSPASTRSPRPRTQATVYFLIDHGLAAIGVRRRMHGTDLARGALRLLLEGPTATERKYGVSSAIPDHVTIRSFSLAPTLTPVIGSAFVDLAGLPAPGRAGPVRLTRIGTQIARSLIGVSGITRIWIRSNGRPWGFLSVHGSVLRKPWDYPLLVSLGTVCGAKWHTESVSGDCFSPLP